MKGTLGNTPASIRLEQLIENCPRARRKVQTILSLYTNQLLQITQAREPGTVHLCMELLRDYTLRRVDIAKHLTEDMKTYTKNVVTARYRIFLHCFDDVIKHSRKKT